MAGLLSLPNELLIQVLSASPTTRTLCNLANINKRLRAIRIKSSNQIIIDVYRPRISHLKDAVDFTLAEARLVATVTSDAALPELQPLCHYLPRILRNVDLAVKMCDRFTEFRKSLPPDDAWYTEPKTSLHVHTSSFAVQYWDILCRNCDPNYVQSFVVYNQTIWRLARDYWTISGILRLMI